MIEKVKEELMAGYPGETPVAVIERASWPQQKVVRGMLKDIVELVQGEGIKKTALIYVGESLKASVAPLGKESKLYNKEFKHEYRK
jgi:precorrin-4/cobalt-precorrin-4 C11-methyltransferase